MNQPTSKTCTRKLFADLAVGLAISLIVIARSRSGFDRIPGDPGYEGIHRAVRDGFQLFGLAPYLHVDQTFVASIGAWFPVYLHAVSTNLLSHVIWIAAAYSIYQAARRLDLSILQAAACGMALVLVPWAAESSLGNYGNVRWPLLAASVTVVAAELCRPIHSWTRAMIASLVASLSNPVSVVLAVPVAIALARDRAERPSPKLLLLVPPLVVLCANVIVNGASGHQQVTRSFWNDAGLFWWSGQLLPPIAALSGLVAVMWSRSRADWRSSFAVQIFAASIATATISYWLGGIADRYFTVPAVLSGVGWVVFLSSARGIPNGVRRLGTAVLSLALLIPAVRWFEVAPFLSSGPAWTNQIESAREACTADPESVPALVVSSGVPIAATLTCDDLD